MQNSKRKKREASARYYQKHRAKILIKKQARDKGEYFCVTCRKDIKYSSQWKHNKSHKHIETAKIRALDTRSIGEIIGSWLI